MFNVFDVMDDLTPQQHAFKYITKSRVILKSGKCLNKNSAKSKF